MQAALAEAFTKYAGFPKEQVIVLASNQLGRSVSRHAGTYCSGSRTFRGDQFRKTASCCLLLRVMGSNAITTVFFCRSDAKMSDHIRVLQSTALSVTEIRDWIRRDER